MFNNFTKEQVIDINVELLKLQLLINFSLDKISDIERLLKKGGAYRMGIKKDVSKIASLILKLNQNLYKQLDSTQRDIFINMLESEDKDVVIDNRLTELIMNNSEDETA